MAPKTCRKPCSTNHQNQVKQSEKAYLKNRLACSTSETVHCRCRYVSTMYRSPKKRMRVSSLSLPYPCLNSPYWNAVGITFWTVEVHVLRFYLRCPLQILLSSHPKEPLHSHIAFSGTSKHDYSAGCQTYQMLSVRTKSIPHRFHLNRLWVGLEVAGFVGVTEDGYWKTSYTGHAAGGEHTSSMRGL